MQAAAPMTSVQRYAGGGYDRGLDAGSSGEQQTPGTGPLLALCKTLVSIEPAHQNYEEPVITTSAPLHIVTRLIVTCTFT